MKKITIFVFGFFLFFVYPFEALAREKIGIGLPAPHFTLETTTGAKVRISDFKGKVVLLDFWATWCPPCRFSIPALIQLHKKYKNKNFAILGINMDEYRKPVLSFVRKQKIEYWVLYGGKEQVGLDYRIRAIPSFFLLDPSGKIVKIYSGFYPGLEKEWEEEIERLLSEKDEGGD